MILAMEKEFVSMGKLVYDEEEPGIPLLATLSTLASHLQGRYSPHSLMCLMDECE